MWFHDMIMGNKRMLKGSTGNTDIILTEVWYTDYGDDFYEMGTFDQWLFTFYDQLNILFSADIKPVNHLQFVILIVFLFAGALENAYVFGTLTCIVEMMNTGTQKTEDLLQVSNISMAHIHVEENLQNRIRTWLLYTSKYLDDQNEMEEFFGILSPSLRLQVAKDILTTCVNDKYFFNNDKNIMDYIVTHVNIALFSPEDIIISCAIYLE